MANPQPLYPGGRPLASQVAMDALREHRRDLQAREAARLAPDPKRVLVTGGAGFIGSHLVDALVEHGCHVTVFDDLSTGSMLNLLNAQSITANADNWRRGNFEVCHGDVRDTDRVCEVFRRVRPEVVYHLAASIDVRESVQDPVRDASINVLGTVQVLQEAQQHGARHFTLVSSAATLGDGDDLPLPRRADEHPNPISPYGAAKAAAELYVAQADRWPAGMGTSIAVLSNVYGPRQRAGVGAVNLFARLLLAGDDVVLYGDGHNVRDYLHVSDAVRVLLRQGGFLPTAVSRGPRELIGTGAGTTDVELLDIVAGAVGTVPTIRWAPARECDIRSMVFPTVGAYVALRDGVRDTVETIRKELGLWD